MPVQIHHLDDTPLREQIRTLLYGDQRVTINELQILHTQAFQRLYNLKQLGWTDRIFPDAVHSRFNHSLGTLEQADRMVQWIVSNCRSNNKAELAKKLEKDRWVVRITALMHDVFHIPYGHTLEDELGVLPRHDEDEIRKILLLDRVLAEVLYWSHITHCINSSNTEVQTDFWKAYESGQGLNEPVKVIYNDLLQCKDDAFQLPGGVRHFVSDFAKASEALLYMGQYKIFIRERAMYTWSKVPPLSHLLIGAEKNPLFHPGNDYYICDIVGNTICADLLDYGRRDIYLSGMKMQYDDRLLQHFTLVKNKEEIIMVKQDDGSEEIKSSVDRIHTAIDLIRGRIRYDALTEILQILKIRYSLTERVIYHRTKCAAGAMLGKAVALLNLGEEERLHMKRLGDAEFIEWLEQIAKVRLQNKMDDIDAQGSLSIIRALRARRFYKPVYHVRSYPQLRPTEKGHPATVLSDLNFRRNLESQIEKKLGFTAGSVIIYCPSKTQLKEARCLVIYDKGEKFEPLSEVPVDGPIGFFAKEARTIEQEYNYLWNLYVFVPSRLVFYWPVIARCFEDEYKQLLPNGKAEELEPLTNDRFMVAYLIENCKALGLDQIEKDIQSLDRTGGLNCVYGLVKGTEEEMNVIPTYERHRDMDTQGALFRTTSRINFFDTKLRKLIEEIKAKETQDKRAL